MRSKNLMMLEMVPALLMLPQVFSTVKLHMRHDAEPVTISSFANRFGMLTVRNKENGNWFFIDAEDVNVVEVDTAMPEYSRPDTFEKVQIKSREIKAGRITTFEELMQ